MFTLLFDDIYGITTVTSYLNLELIQDYFPLVPSMSPSIVIGYVPNWFVASSSSKGRHVFRHKTMFGLQALFFPRGICL